MNDFNCDACGTVMVISGSKTVDFVADDGAKSFYIAYQCYCPKCGKLVYVDNGVSEEG